MSLTLPDLDDRTYADLLEEARALIPGLYPAWTNHNPTDPGITLIELFAWLTEMLLFRVNRLPKENVQTFLRLLNGPDWTPGTSLDDDVRLTVADLRARHRAVTADDYELLAREASPGVARSRCGPLRNLQARSEEDRANPRPGHVSVILVPDREQPGAVDPASWEGAPLPGEALIETVQDYLAPRRLLTVRQSVAAPVYVPVQPEIVVARRQDVPEATLRESIRQELERFLDPLAGGEIGAGGEGWPFGRDVYVSELYQLLEKIPGVDYVPDLALASECPAGAPRCIAATPLWHDDGDFVGLGLGAHHLAWALVDPGRLFFGVASAFVPVTVRLKVVAVAAETVAGGPPRAEIRRAVKGAVRALFHPLRQGPDGQEAWEITDQTLRTAVLGVTGVADVSSVKIEADPRWLFQQPPAKGFRLKAGELADVTVQVDGV